MKVTLVKPQGFCSGVLKAVSIAKKARLEHPNKKIYILGMLAHNKTLTDDLAKEGLITLDDTDEFAAVDSLNQGDVLIFTAHGHNDAIEEKAKQKGLIIYDATCFKVKSNLEKIKREIESGHQVIYIGQKGHKETNAALSVSKNVSLYDTQLLINYYLITDNNPYVINQTTLNYKSLNKYYSDILEHIPGARIENEICAATRLRQEAVTKIDKDTDLIIVVGHQKSSNSNKLFEIAKSNYPSALVLMVNNLKELQSFSQIESKKKAAVISGASTPQYVVDEIYNYLLSK